MVVVFGIFDIRIFVTGHDEEPVLKLFLDRYIFVSVYLSAFAFEHELQVTEMVLTERMLYVKLRRGI